MSDYDLRDQNACDRDNGARDREEIVPGSAPGSLAHDNGTGRDAPERDRESRDPRNKRAGTDPRDVFSRDLNLPRRPDRELVQARHLNYRLNGWEVRTLSTVGAFRIVPERDLGDHQNTECDGRRPDLRNLEKQGLIQRVPVTDKCRAVALTARGRALLEQHRTRDAGRCQQFYAGVDRPRERSHDAQCYLAYLEAAKGLRDQGARIERVQLDRELKREYQRFLQERNFGDRDSDGRPDRSQVEIAAWAREHDLPYFDDHVHFPDVRIEYEDANGDVRFEDIEVVTEHYRGAHRASAARCGFSTHVSRRGGGGTFDPRVAEDFV
jgi:DNA-binding MarR family transcriptional regulator